MVSSTNLLAKGQNNKETKLNRITKLTLLGKRTPFPSDCSELGHQSSPVLRLKWNTGFFWMLRSPVCGQAVYQQILVSSFLTADNWEVLSLYHFMANRWGKSRNSDRLYFLGLQNHYGQWHSDCSHEIKRHLLLGRKVMTNIDSILKSRDITLPTKVRIVKVMIFPVVTCRCEGWTVKKSEC